MTERLTTQNPPHFELTCSKGSVDIQVGTGFKLFTHHGWALQGRTGRIHRYPNGQTTPIMKVTPPRDINPDEYSQKHKVLSDGKVLFEITADTIADAVLEQRKVL